MHDSVRNALRLGRTWLLLFGLNPKAGWRALRNLPWFLRDYRTLRRQAALSKFSFPFGPQFPCLYDKQDSSGAASGAYFHQDLLVARRIFEARPERHIDVGSRVDGFVAHVACFREIEVFDIRPLPNLIPNVHFHQADLMDLHPSLEACCDSLSCLHTIEHFGLGRYGDPINFDGFDIGLRNLNRILRPGGTFYFSTPIGPQRIEFNAHRVFSVGFLLDYFRADYSLRRFSYVDDRGDLHDDVALAPDEVARNFGCRYGCGIFEWVKR
jgi:SAM-dependent methyltransferase